MTACLPTASGLPRRLGDFATVLEALDYAAGGETGLDFHDARGERVASLPYRTLRAEALLLARRLLGLGFRPGDRVALIAETGPAFVQAFFACQYAGLVPAPMPLPLAFGGRAAYLVHIGRLVAEARATALLAPSALVEWFRPLAGEMGLRLCRTVAELDDTEPSDAALPVIEPGALAYLQFSSGSTRFPMGISVRHEALIANVAGILAHGLRVRDGDRAVSWLPLYHDMGLVGFLLTPLCGQITVDFLATQDFARRPLLWLSLISDRRATISYSPSFGYDLCIRRAAQAGAATFDLSCWRIAGIGGDMIRPEVLAGFADVFAPCGFSDTAFLPSYGMAEATLAISFAGLGRGIEIDRLDSDRLEQEGIAVAPPDDVTRSRTLVLCGTALPGHRLEIRDPQGDVLPDRHVGRIFARGPSLMLGYDGRPDETTAVLSADLWLDTGDLGYRAGPDRDDSLVITGRAKDLIIVNGRNIWPQDLEWTIEHAVPGIRTGRVAAFSIERDGQEVVVLAAEPRALSEATTSDALIAMIADTVRARHGVEGRVVLLAPGTLPYTSSGKLSRSATRALYLSGSLAITAAA